MRSIPQDFYRSSEWKACRESYLQKQPLCERCLEKGIITPAEIVHHVIHLTQENYLFPEIALNHKNLQAVCLSCHNQIHGTASSKRRWFYDPDGNLQAK